MSIFETIDRQLVIAILEFVIAGRNFGSVVYLKKVCKMFHLVISSPMFGRLVNLWCPVEYQRLQYKKLHELLTELSQLEKLEQSPIRNVNTFMLVVFMESSRRPCVSLDFMKHVNHLTVNFCDNSGNIYQRFNEENIHLPKSLQTLRLFCNLEDKKVRVAIGSMKGGIGVESVELWTDDQIYGTVTMWREFFITHKNTLKKLIFNQGINFIERNFPVAASSECHVQQLNIVILYNNIVSDYEVNISMFVQLKNVCVKYLREPETNTEDKLQVMMIVHITMTHEQSKTVTIQFPKSSLVKKIIIY